MPHDQMFARMHRNLRSERSSLRRNMHDMGRKRLTRNVNVGKRILRALEDYQKTSTVTIAQQLGICQSAAWRIQHEQCVYPYLLQCGLKVA
ncbi:hypothetical protein TNCT_625991 [Trichonephila clavata]|uniref:Uncharacterized protein n=1 Tax=Trichonephila clavata TaxID=2740835 RepID=A0A8X6L3K4_TRICU|nr:hypothetical protein TNCT_625991 [Trichonephila clavata]